MDTFPFHQSLSSFLLIVLLFFSPASSAHEDNQRFLDCLPTTFDCGGAQLNISYPFWTEDTPEHCRSPQELEMEIKCNRADNSSEIVIQKRLYHVMRIDYKDQKATIVDKDYYLVHKDMIPCHAPSSNTSLDSNLLNYTQRDLNLSFLYNCPHPLGQDNPDFKFINCSSSNQYRDHAYFTFLQHITGPFINCHMIKIPIHSTNKDRLIWLNPEEFWIVNVLAGGFEVSWSFTLFDHLCWEYCLVSNGQCRSNETSPKKRECYCDGNSFPDECPPPPSPAPAPAPLPGAITGVILTCCFVFILCLVRKLPSDNSIFFWKKETCDSRNVEAFLENYGSLAPKRYRYSELKKMTRSFKDNLGHGGYGSVFKGNLKDGRLVAVKNLKRKKENGKKEMEGRRKEEEEDDDDDDVYNPYFQFYGGGILCLGNSTDNNKTSFVFRGGDVPEFEWSKYCEESVVVPMLVSEAEGGNYIDFRGLLLKGFDLDWDSGDGDCMLCEVTNGCCGYGSN
ncbi:LEAF RUST 10 DISEASE-RESISTANCE LOCUS RECEPTOR-LIKE PROTEIN KINASE-like protein 2.4 [Cinnamomum micranthum f. kanehirae]|uniref:LEAF RUST 10 DISEASE-RESISTANCE LOCUS RECEPTOR-LIKE PROTEIN KINASE-like protein 2.4 n=1 Tax=Cinnamomum micranthum f. kanehirae TaxID=337451 RepID=A0A3S4NV78_9MAGN|nr:LEAF RUST 10 DISEASE-RESISTANCE LOCUS RECEPTOR-LIKE PROTEIN KINASE-like protein 2.4 [Cinnamomum micranthum f. kanehirae]